MKLLIVDDNKYVVAFLRKQLNWEAFGIEELIGVYSVEQAKEVFLNKQIDFLITDIEMPVQNGFDLLEWLKNQIPNNMEKQFAKKSEYTFRDDLAHKLC